jgi:hypothetical protein
VDLLNTFLPIIVIGLIGLVVGALFGALLSGGMSGSAKTDGKTPGKDFSQPLRIWRDRRNGRIFLGLEDNVYPSVEKLTPRQRNSVQQTVDAVYFWLGINEPTLRIPKPAVSASSTAAASHQQTVPAVPTGELNGITPPQAGVTGAVSTVVPQVGIQEAKGKEKEMEAPKSIAAQVDEILQERLPQSHLRHRAVRLMELPLRGLVVMVDGQAYEGVGDVPDEEVRQLIQECVAEWERTR